MDIASHAGQLSKFLGELQSTKQITMMELSGSYPVLDLEYTNGLEATLWRDPDSDFASMLPSIMLQCCLRLSQTSTAPSRSRGLARSPPNRGEHPRLCRQLCGTQLGQRFPRLG